MKKIFGVLAILFFFSAEIFAQDGILQFEDTESVIVEEPAKERKQLFGSSFTPPKNAKEFWHQVSPFVNIGATITVNTESKTKSAPSPVNFSLAVGAIWPNNAFISFQPRLNIYTTYYLWDGENALPAEVENRTALALSFMIDLPAATTFRFEKFQVEAGMGLGILARFALLANGVSESDSGTTGTAGGDRDEIQKWFFSNMRFLYPEIFAACEYKFSEKIKVGLEARYYIPLGSLATGRGMDASIVMVSAKLIF